MHPATSHPVLILGAATRIAIPIARSLHRAGIAVEAASFMPEDPVLRSSSIRAFHRLPHKDKAPAEFIDALCALIRHKDFDMLFPVSDPALAAISQNYDRLKPLINPGCPPPPVVNRVLNKTVTIELAESCGIQVPFSCLVANLCDLDEIPVPLPFPVVVKPAERGSRSFKVLYCRDAGELRATVSANQFGAVLIQEYSPGVGVGVEVIMHGGNAVVVFQHRRLQEEPPSGGVAVMAIAEEPHPLLLDNSLKLLRAMEWEGPAMVEYRYDRQSGRIALMEVNGRFWGTSSLPIHAGLDFPLYAWQIAHGIEPHVPASYRVGTRWRWTAGYVERLRNLMARPRPRVGPTYNRWRELADIPRNCSPAIHDALWAWSDPLPALSDLFNTVRHLIAGSSKWLARRILPRAMLQDRGIYRRLGPKAGSIFLKLRVFDALGIRTQNKRKASPRSRRVLFVCFGNLMRSPMAEAMFKKCLLDNQGSEYIEVSSAGLHAHSGREAHPWAQIVSSELGILLTNHRARLLTLEMVKSADVIFAMDFQNKAELLALYPEAREKIIMLGAYSEGILCGREIPDPYFGDLDATRKCYERLQECVEHVVAGLSQHPTSSRRDPANAVPI